MRPLLLFAHGAGAPSASPWMRGWAARLERIGRVFCFDYPYLRDERRRPDPQRALIAAHREALALARAEHDAPVVLVGKSLGGRIGCHVALEEPSRALVCLGYPLIGNARGDVRDKVLLALQTPVLFVQGTRDHLTPLDRLEEVRAQMQAPSELYVVETGDHSLTATKRWLAEHGLSQDDVDARATAAIARFVEKQIPG